MTQTDCKCPACFSFLIKGGSITPVMFQTAQIFVKRADEESKGSECFTEL